MKEIRQQGREKMPATVRFLSPVSSGNIFIKLTGLDPEKPADGKSSGLGLLCQSPQVRAQLRQATWGDIDLTTSWDSFLFSEQLYHSWFFFTLKETFAPSMIPVPSCPDRINTPSPASFKRPHWQEVLLCVQPKCFLLQQKPSWCIHTLPTPSLSIGWVLWA